MVLAYLLTPMCAGAELAYGNDPFEDVRVPPDSLVLFERGL